MIAIGRRVLKVRDSVDALVLRAMGASAPSMPAILAAADGKVCLTFLQRDENELPLHVRKSRRPRLVIICDGPLEGGTASPGPASWRSADLLHHFRPVACMIHTVAAGAEQYLGAVALAMKAGPVLLIECSPERAADWEWLVTPWCPTVATYPASNALQPNGLNRI